MNNLRTILLFAVGGLLLGALCAMRGALWIMRRKAHRRRWELPLGIFGIALAAFSLYYLLAMFPIRQQMPTCAANLRLIGEAISQYEETFHAAPADLSDLTASGLIDPMHLRSPFGEGNAPHYTYIISPAAPSRDPRPIVYGPLVPRLEGRFVLFANGTVEFCHSARLQEIKLPLKEQEKRDQ